MFLQKGSLKLAPGVFKICILRGLEELLASLEFFDGRLSTKLPGSPQETARCVTIGARGAHIVSRRANMNQIWCQVDRVLRPRCAKPVSRSIQDGPGVSQSRSKSIPKFVFFAPDMSAHQKKTITTTAAGALATATI